MLEKYVLTGGPGTGKSTVLAELEKIGYHTCPEAARLIIQEEQEKENGILPWSNLYEFEKKNMQRQCKLEWDLERQIRKEVLRRQQMENIPWTEQTKERMIFLDRGIHDALAYCLEGCIPAPPGYPYLSEVTSLRYDKIFLLEPLPDYLLDTVRREDSQKAQRLHQHIQIVYAAYEYTLIPVPVLPPAERAQFILKQIEQIKQLEQAKQREQTEQTKQLLQQQQLQQPIEVMNHGRML